MNQVFNARRFGLLVAKHWTEHRRQYGLSVFVLAGMMIVWYIAFKPEMGSQRVLFLLTVLLGGAIHASTSFHELGNPAQGVGALTLPASQAEKLWTALLFSLLFLPVAMGLYYAITAPFLSYYQSITPDKSMTEFPKEVLFIHDDEIFIGIAIFYFFVHAAALLGSISFKKQTFMKTTAVVFVLSSLLVYINDRIAYGLLFDGRTMNVKAGIPFTSVSLQLKNDHYHWIDLPSQQQQLVYVFLSLIVVALWYITFLKLKEKQI